MEPSGDQATTWNTVTCPNCGASAPAGGRFCEECGGARQQTCPTCGAPLSPAAQFCGECGAVTVAGAAPGPAAHATEAVTPNRAGTTRRKTPPAVQAAPTQQPADLPQGGVASPVQPSAISRKARGGQKIATSSLPASGQPGRLKTLFLMMTNPGQVVAARMSTVSWPFALLVSGSAFSLFFLQTGLDIARGNDEVLRTAGASAVIGALYGSVGIVFMGVLAWLLSRLFAARQPAGWVIRALALSYSSALVYAAIGLPFNLVLGWNTSLAFGVTGVLWALGPMNAVFKELSGGRIGPGIALATVCGGLVLLGWATLTL